MTTTAFDDPNPDDFYEPRHCWWCGRQIPGSSQPARPQLDVVYCDDVCRRAAAVWAEDRRTPADVNYAENQVWPESLTERRWEADREADQQPRRHGQRGDL